MHGQTLINAAISASSYALAGISFYLTFSVARFFHFTHGAFIALGAYATYALMRGTGIPLLPAAIAAVFTTGLAAGAMDWALFCRLRRSGGGAFIPLLASLGCYTGRDLENAVTFSTLVASSEARAVAVLLGAVSFPSFLRGRAYLSRLLPCFLRLRRTF
jgi:branched-subunit amino acid ABC-type transport system permease component